MSTNWKMWGITGSKCTPELHEEIMAIPGMHADDRGGIPVFNGSLGDFQRHYKKPFTVESVGFYIGVGQEIVLD